MARPKTIGKRTNDSDDRHASDGRGGETHQTAGPEVMTTNQGVAVSDDQSSLKAGPLGPTLLEDFILREKLTHFDHERIPERVVNARGSGAHGYFEVEHSLSSHTRAAFLQTEGDRTEVFVRFSTMGGGAGSTDVTRDVRGFAVKFYTSDGNFDLVGNNMPVFFIQDAVKLPDLVHAARMEPDRGFPQAATAHDTFWDFVSLTPESMHMIMWAMSDRALPRSYRMMEGYGVHTFRLVSAAGVATFVKFHLRPKLGVQSLVFDEALKINGADPDYHRRDLWEAIDRGDFPEWELYVQLFTREQASAFDFDVLDATKLIPEEVVPLRKVGRLVLDRNPTNFFAETEQVAFSPANVVPGIDFSDDPLLQGRLFSYLDAQLSRLGSPNHHEIHINAARCPVRNFQRDGQMQPRSPAGRVAYEPNTLAPDGARESPGGGFTSFARTETGAVLRARSGSFGDHYTQARLFWKSQAPVEQGHIVAAFVFELGRVETPAIRGRMVSHLVHVDPTLAVRVAAALGMEHVPAAAPTTALPRDVERSHALGLIGRARRTIEGRVVGCLVTDGADGALFDTVLAAVEEAGARLAVLTLRVGGVRLAKGRGLTGEAALRAAPSVLFDAVVVIASEGSAGALAKELGVIEFIRDAYSHLKVIGYAPEARSLVALAGIEPDGGDPGIVALDPRQGGLERFIRAAEAHRIWKREPAVHAVL